MNHQDLRNALAEIEDEARACRNIAARKGKDATPFHLISLLTKIIREEIVK